MANTLYPKGKEAILGSLDVSADTIKAVLTRSGSYNSGHQYLSDFTGAGGSVVASATLASKTLTNGVFDAADVTYSAVGAGASCNAIVIYKDTGAAGTSPLLAWIDTATNLPITPNGGDITVTWDNGASKIFAL